MAAPKTSNSAQAFSAGRSLSLSQGMICRARRTSREILNERASITDAFFAYPPWVRWRDISAPKLLGKPGLAPRWPHYAELDMSSLMYSWRRGFFILSLL